MSKKRKPTTGNRFTFKQPGKYWRVTFVYSIEKYTWGSLDDVVRKLVGNTDGGGTGFGERDQDWCFSNENAAKRALKLLKKLDDGEFAYSYLDECEFES